MPPLATLLLLTLVALHFPPRAARLTPTYRNPLSPPPPRPVVLPRLRRQAVDRCPVLLPIHPPNDASIVIPSQSPTNAPIPSPSTSPPPAPPPFATPSASPPLLPPSRLTTPHSHTRPSSPSISRNVVSPRVVGGASVSEHLRPYIAVLRFVIAGQQGVCSATLVSPTLIITAAHCVPVKDPSDLKIYVGATRGNPPNGEEHSAHRIVFHPLFDVNNAATARYDIAWVRLSSHVSNSSRFMRVNANASIPVQGSVIRNIGYGRFDPDKEESNPQFEAHQIDLPVTGHNYCRRKWVPYGVYIDPMEQVCTGYLNGGCGSCNGDSGGPIFQYDSLDRPVLVGVASIAVRCSVTQVPTVYVRTSAYVQNFLPQSGLRLSYKTDPYILPMVNRTSPTGQGSSHAASSNFFDQISTGTWVAVSVSACCALLLMGFLVRWAVVRKSAQSPPPPQPHLDQGPLLSSQQYERAVQPNFVSPNEFIGGASGGSGSNDAMTFSQQTNFVSRHSPSIPASPLPPPPPNGNPDTPASPSPIPQRSDPNELTGAPFQLFSQPYIEQLHPTESPSFPQRYVTVQPTVNTKQPEGPGPNQDPTQR